MLGCNSTSVSHNMYTGICSMIGERGLFKVGHLWKSGESQRIAPNIMLKQKGMKALLRHFARGRRYKS